MAGTELETFARALGRTRKELEEQIDNAESPETERRRLARKADRVRSRIEHDEEDRILEGFSEDARRRYELLRTVTDAEMQQARASLTLGRQLDQALADASLLSAIAAAEIGGAGPGGKLEGRGPGRIEGALYSHSDLDVAALYRLIFERMLANLWREVDGARRGSLADVRKHETSEQKDERLLRDWEGFRSEIVSVLDPTFGSPRSVEQMRRRKGRRPIDGMPMKASRVA
jgi:hypothetical protein